MDPAELKIDILDDSVNEILDKLFYQASDGKLIDYAWDAPQPACVNPLSKEEAREWGGSAMNSVFTRVAAEPKRRGTKRVSALARFTQRGTAKPYYGYKSEPPKSRATAAEEPIGPLAKAIKAAGVLSALSKHKGDKETHVWKLLEGTWGEIPIQVKTNAEPDLTNTSRKDEIKFARSPSHMIFGFNSDSPSVTVTMGNYLSHSMDKPYMFDWHAMATSLRFIGEFIKRYVPADHKPGSAIAFSPATQEARLLSSPDYSIAESSVQTDTPDIALAKLTAKTFREFTTGVSSVVTRNNLASSKKSVKVEVGVEVADSIMTAIAASGEVRRNRLPKNIFATPSIPTNKDIMAETGDRFRRSVLANANKISDKWVPTWRSVHSIVWQMFFETDPKNATSIMGVIRMKPNIDEMDSRDLKHYATELAVLIPKSLGLTIFQLLNHMLADKETAIVEFAKMVRELSNSEVFNLESNYSTMYISAIARSSSIDSMTKYIQRAYNGYTTRTLGATKLKNLLKDNEASLNGITRAFERFFEDRSEYWSAFYASRVSESSKHLTALKGVALRYNVKGFFKLGKKLPLDKPFATLDFGKDIKDLQHLRDTIADLKVTTVMYSFVSMAYKLSITKVNEDFSARVYLTPERLCKVILASADNYARKRKTWGKNLAYDEDQWIAIRDSIQRCNRAIDMLTLVDDFFNPKVPWVSCYAATKVRFEKSSKSITNLLRNHLALNTLDNDDNNSLEVKEMRALDTKAKSQFKTYNMYSVLEDDDESSSDDGSTASTEIDGKVEDKDAIDIDDRTADHDEQIDKHKLTTEVDEESAVTGELLPSDGLDTTTSSAEKPEAIEFDFSSLTDALMSKTTRATTTKHGTYILLVNNAPPRSKNSAILSFIATEFDCEDPLNHKSEIAEADRILANFFKFMSNLPETDAFHTDAAVTSDNVDIV